MSFLTLFLLQVNCLETMHRWNVKETRLAYPVGTMNVQRLCNSGSSGILSSPLPVRPTTLLESCSEPSDSHRVIMQRNRSDRLTSQFSPRVSTIYSLPPQLSSHSILSHERHSDSGSFDNEAPKGAPFPPAYSSGPGTFQAPANTLSQDPTTWCPDSIPSMLNFSDDATTRNNQAQSSSMVMSDDDISTNNEWWNDASNEEWKELLGDINVSDSQPKVLEFCSSNCRISQKEKPFFSSLSIHL